MLLAQAAGVGSAFGMWSTLNIMEVVPFLILAVGVHNLCALLPNLPCRLLEHQGFRVLVFEIPTNHHKNPGTLRPVRPAAHPPLPDFRVTGI